MSSGDNGATTTVCENNISRRISRPRPRHISVTTCEVPLVEGAKPFQASDYDIGSVLGSGTFATVKLARRRCDGKQFALKVFCASDQEVRECISKEHRIQASIRHPCIVSVDALYMHGCTLYLSMEYAAGGSVDNHIKRHGPMSEETAQRLFSHLLQGIDHIHCKRIVHRDLKPQNLVLDADACRLKITDFGSSTELASNQHFSMLTGRAGTALFLAPEVHFGYNWNERVDIWASGLCFYFMLRGNLPFDLQSRKVRRTLQKGCLPDWGAQNFSPLIEDMLQQCLKVLAWDRPPAMELLLHPMFTRTAGANFQGESCDEEQDSTNSERHREPLPNFSCDRRGCAGAVDPKSLYSLLKSCGLVCVHSFQKVESPSAHQGNSTLQALAGVKCLRGVAKMARSASNSSKESMAREFEDDTKPDTPRPPSALEPVPNIFYARSLEHFFDDQVPCDSARRPSKNMVTHLQNGGSVESAIGLLTEDCVAPRSRQWTTDG